ncbi:MAG: nicotinamide-nucleotide adenylyltransferase [Thermoplasmatota archaeon]
MMTILFIGRFQPFHQGHLQLLEKQAASNKRFLIGIGSSQYQYTLQNPFSYAERKEMIQQSLNAIDLTSYQIEPITDIHDPPNWVEHVEKTVPDFDTVLTNNPFTASLFETKGYSVSQTTLFNREKLNGTYIRQCIINNKPWEHLVPPSVFEYIQKINGCSRLQALAAAED